MKMWKTTDDMSVYMDSGMDGGCDSNEAYAEVISLVQRCTQWEVDGAWTPPNMAPLVLNV